MQKGEINSVRILEENTIDTMMTLHYPTIAPNYGFFFQNFKNFWGHDGGAPGVATRMFFNPTRDIGVIVLMNIENPTAVDLISSEIYQFAEHYVTLVEHKENENQLLSNFILRQNYPNPFNSETKIEFSLSNSAHVDLKILDIMGREINTLINKNCDAGVHHINWNGKGKNGSIMPSGLYLYQIKTNGFCSTKKLIFSK